MSANHPRDGGGRPAAATVEAASARPDRELIAFVATWDREMRRLSAAELAGLAGVEIESIERIERAQDVGDDVLRRVALALGRPGNAFVPG